MKLDNDELLLVSILVDVCVYIYGRTTLFSSGFGVIDLAFAVPFGYCGFDYKGETLPLFVKSFGWGWSVFGTLYYYI